jgi:nucleotide-binding universal stress UspA family protein
VHRWLRIFHEGSRLCSDAGKAKRCRGIRTQRHCSQLGYAYYAGAFGLVTPNTINAILENSKQEAQKWFDDIGKNAVTSGVKFKTEVVASPTSTVRAIVDYAERNEVDLIVVGTRGRSGFTKLLLGSVASGVVTYASCPVMVVK